MEILISILVLSIINVIIGIVLIRGIRNVLELTGSFAQVTADNFVTVDDSINSCKRNTVLIDNKVTSLINKVDTIQDTVELIAPLCRNGYPKLDEIIENTKPKPKKTKKTSEK